MRLQWVGQFEMPVCPPGSFLDPFARICVSPTQGQVPAVNPNIPPPVTTVPVVTVTPTQAEKERSRALVYAAAIVGAGIVTAVVLSKVVS